MLAEQGADVLHISAPHQLDAVVVAMDTGVGKRSANLDLQKPDDVRKAQALAADSDMFVHSWRTGSFDRHGLSPDELARRRPGIIYVSVSAYGSGGPWATRGGYEPVGQAACGLAIEEGFPDAPRLSPTGTLNDYLTAYLASAGALAALIRRSREGGSYHVKVSLTRTSMWVQEIGRLPEAQWLPHEVPLEPYRSAFVEMDGPFGRLSLPAPLAQYSETRAYWERPPEPFGASKAIWMPRAG